MTAPSIKLIEASLASHPEHMAELVRLKRVKGQIEGIERMILEKRYCPDIIMQARAAASALRAFEAAILQTHLRGCVKNAMQSKDPLDADRKIQEILEIIK